MMHAKDMIAEKFIDLCNKKNVHKLTVSDICNELHISRTTFYKHFTDKYELINYIFIMDRNVILKSFKGKLNGKELIIYVLERMKSKKNYYINLSNDYSHDSFFPFLYKEIYNTYINAAKELDAYNSDTVIEIAYAAAGITNILIIWIKKGMIESCEEISNILYSVSSDFIKKLDNTYIKQIDGYILSKQPED